MDAARVELGLWVVTASLPDHEAKGEMSMSVINTMSGRAVALTAFAATAIALVVSAPLRQAEAAPAANLAGLYEAEANPAVHNARVIRKVTNGAGQKKIHVAGRNYDKSPKFKQVIVNGKRVPRRVDAPVVRDHRAPRPSVRDHRVTGGVSVRDHRTK
jgi:hypothetical protein